MINKLTPKQEKQLIEFREECLKIGLSTEPIKREIKEYKEIIDYIYKNYLNLSSPVIWYVDSPLMLNLLTNLVFPHLEKFNLWNNLGNNLGNNLRNNLRNNLENNLQKLKYFQNIWWGNLDIYWLSFYIFPEKYLGVSYTDFQITSLEYFYQLCQKIGWIWYFKDICFISDRPIFINKKGMLLHSESQPAISFRDGYSIWCLNGVNVTKEIVETPAEKLDPHLVITEKNAEVRREIIRKIGIERVVQKLGTKLLDKKGDYELLDINLGENRFRPYLKMRNPSIGVYHIEGVSPECRTVEQALNFRKPKELREIPISENGEDWFQQGDVCIWKKGAKFVKPKPSILT